MLQETVKRLATRARQAMPEPVRMAYRSVRSLVPVPPSRSLPQSLVGECRVCADRLAMLDMLPRGGVVAELGTLRGDFAREILGRCSPRALHLVDLDMSRLATDISADPRVTTHIGRTDLVIASFPDDSFDWIYVDADHSHEGVLRDARASAAKVRPGGFLVFNDFAHVDPSFGRYGVHRAVVDFVIETSWPVALFAFNPAALYDIALRRPL